MLAEQDGPDRLIAAAQALGDRDQVRCDAILFAGVQRLQISPLSAKDTVLVPKGEEARVILRFDDYKGKYILHCHNLSHEDSSMMTNFEVI